MFYGYKMHPHHLMSHDEAVNDLKIIYCDSFLFYYQQINKVQQNSERFLWFSMVARQCRHKREFEGQKPSSHRRIESWVGH